MVVFHLFIVSTFPIAVPLEWNVLFAYATHLLVPRASRPGTAMRLTDMSPPWLTVVIVAALVFFPILGQLPARQGVVPAVDAPVRRQLGVGGVGVRPGRGGQAQQGHPLREEPGRPVQSNSATSRSGPKSRCSRRWPGGDAQPGPGPVLGAAEDTCRRHRHPHRARSRVRLQLVGRVQLRRRPLARRGHDRRRPARGGFEPGELVVVWVESQAGAARCSTTR